MEILKEEKSPNISLDNLFFIDFEFTPSASRYFDLICATTLYREDMRSHMLMDKLGRQDLGTYIEEVTRTNKDVTLVAYGIDSEVRCIMSLLRVNFLEELPFKKFICLFREYLLLSNRSRELCFGEVIGTDGKLMRRRWTGDRGEGEADRNYKKLTHALHKLCGIYSPEHIEYKATLAKMCGRGHKLEIYRNIKAIMRYCDMDTVDLPKLYLAMHKRYCAKGVTREVVEGQMQYKGLYAAMIAEKQQHGYFVNRQGLSNFCQAKPQILKDLAESILSKWEHKTFNWNEKEGRYVKNIATIRKFIETEAPARIRARFPRTPRGEISLATEHFEKLWGDRKHNLSEDDYLQQVYRYLQTENALKGITGAKSKKESGNRTFGDFFDPLEGVARPHYGDFAAQTSRTQPKANSYLLLKPAWIRSLLVPPKNHVMVSCDIGKEEVLYLAIVSQDEKLIEAYASGDPYVHFGKSSGIIKEGMSESAFEEARQICKATVLSILYGMGFKALALKLSNTVGKEVDKSIALQYIRKFERTYIAAYRYKESAYREYRKNKKLSLCDGWTMWGANTNDRSIKNFPVQGGCAVVLRYIDILCRRNKIIVPMTLHDGFYIYVKSIDYDRIALFLQCILQGFSQAVGYLPGHDLVTLDTEVVGEDVSTHPRVEELTVLGRKFKIKFSEKYLDKRATGSLNHFSKYLM